MNPKVSFRKDHAEFAGAVFHSTTNFYDGKEFVFSYFTVNGVTFDNYSTSSDMVCTNFKSWEMDTTKLKYWFDMYLIPHSIS